MSYAVDADITRAATLSPAFYRDAQAYEHAREAVFARSWQWIGTLDDVARPETLSPRTLLPGLLDEPLLLARDAANDVRCLSNVCTHRGNILVHQACAAKQIRCGYHSRRFDLAGRMTFMPEFDGVRDFPSPADDLPRPPFAMWHGLAFASVEPAMDFATLFAEVDADVVALPLDRMRHDPSRDRDYDIDAHWALYVENYLEGFHIPFVHPALNEALDTARYETRLGHYANVQLGIDRDGHVAARYWWVFPNLMLNVYPWGISLNHVLPLGLAKTRVLFRSFVWDAAKLGEGAGGDLDRVEHEDEAVVQAVQRGVRSRFYRGGRYSPTKETGVHHFHRLLCERLARPS